MKLQWQSQSQCVHCAEAALLDLWPSAHTHTRTQWRTPRVAFALKGATRWGNTCGDRRNTSTTAFTVLMSIIAIYSGFLDNQHIMYIALICWMLHSSETTVMPIHSLALEAAHFASLINSVAIFRWKLTITFAFSPAAIAYINVRFIFVLKITATVLSLLYTVHFTMTHELQAIQTERTFSHARLLKISHRNLRAPEGNRCIATHSINSQSQTT